MNNRKNVFQKERLGRFSACVSTLNPSPLCGRETAGNMALFFLPSAVLLLASDADITVKFYTTDPASQSIKEHFPRIYGITSSSHFSAAKPSRAEDFGCKRATRSERLLYFVPTAVCPSDGVAVATLPSTAAVPCWLVPHLLTCIGADARASAPRRCV